MLHCVTLQCTLYCDTVLGSSYLLRFGLGGLLGGEEVLTVIHAAAVKEAVGEGGDRLRRLLVFSF